MREPAPPWRKNWKPWPEARASVAPLQGTRRLAVREQARLQTFPDWFNFVGGTYSAGRQIGNAVPPLFARQLFTSIFAQSTQAKGADTQLGAMRKVENEAVNIA